MTQTASAPSASRAKLSHLALLIPWVAIVINAAERIIDNSFLWHVRAGSVQVSSNRVLTSDPFSFTMHGENWRTQSWLVELAYGWLEGLSGLDFTFPIVVLVSLVLFGGILLLAHRSTGSVVATAIVGLASAVILPRFLAPRPVLFSLALFVLVILGWDDRRTRWALPFLFWMWASVHGGFVVGLVYLGFRTIQKRDFRAGVSLVVVSGIATLLTAHGLGVVSMLLGFVENREYLSLISEWQPPNFLEPDLLPFIAMALTLVYGAVKGRIAAGDLWIIAPFALLALTSSRSVGIAWIALVPIFARALGPIPQLRSRGFGMATTVATTILILFLPFLLGEGSELDEERFPVAAVDHLDDVPTFHDDVSGGFLAWKGVPAVGVYIDDRVELYGARLEEMVDVRSLEEPWQPVFERDGIRQALLLVDEPLSDELVAAGWSTRYSDDSFVVLAHP